MWSGVFDEKELLVLQATDAAAAGSHQLDADLVTALRANFSEQARAELALVIGQAHLFNRVSNVAKQILGD